MDGVEGEDGVLVVDPVLGNHGHKVVSIDLICSQKGRFRTMKYIRTI